MGGMRGKLYVEIIFQGFGGGRLLGFFLIMACTLADTGSLDEHAGLVGRRMLGAASSKDFVADLDVASLCALLKPGFGVQGEPVAIGIGEVRGMVR